MIGPNEVKEGSALRRQVIMAFQSGNNADETIRGNGIALGNGRVVEAFAYNMTPLTVDATLDILPRKIPYALAAATPSLALAQGTILDSPGIRLVAANGMTKVDGVIPAETVITGICQAPGAANVVKLGAGESGVNGRYVNAEIEILDGQAKGQKNICTTYSGAAKTCSMLNLEGSKDWRLPTIAGDIYRVRTRRTVVRKGDLFLFVFDYTANAGGPGTYAAAGIVIEYDDEVDV